MNKKEKIAYNLKVAEQISSISNAISVLQELKETNMEMEYELETSLETLTSAKDELYDCMFMYEKEKGSGEWFYYGLESEIL